jgi:hypothetical protein
MKRIARTLVIVTLASAATVAVAADTPSYPQRADTPYPASAQPQVPLSQEFPNIDTYKKEHRDSVRNQPSVPGPSSAQQEYPLSGEFPNLRSYEDIHKNDPVTRSNTPDYPSSVSPEPSMADEGLVPGIAGKPPYVNQKNDTGRGATR